MNLPKKKLITCTIPKISNMTKVDEFRSKFESALVDIANRTPEETRCLILSGGVDTCAILAAARKYDIKFQAAITVVCGDSSPDKDFAAAAAKEHGIPHHIVTITPEELVSEYLPPCVKNLETFDGMTLRNSLVVAASFQKVSELGFKDIVCGDGADELFGGYSFMWGNEDNPEQWKEKRDKMCAQWTFATSALAHMYGLTPHSPYMEPKFVEWVVQNIVRSDCITTCPIRLVYNGETQDHQTGKLILREAYETVASWRRKDPIEVGSGVTIIKKDDYWDTEISDEQFSKRVEELKDRGFVIKSKESLVNFNVFEKCFAKEKEGGEKVIELSNKKRLEIGKGCAGCCFEIGDRTFCRICGAYPAQRSTCIQAN